MYHPAVPFPLWGAATLQLYYGFFFPILYSGYGILLFSHSSTLSPIASFLLSTLYTLHPCHLSPPCFFLSLVSCFLEKVILYIFDLSFKEKPLSSIFMGLNPLTFTFPTLYIGYYCLLCDLSPLKQKCLFQGHVPLVTIFLCLFPCRTCWPSLLLCLLQTNYMCYLLISPLLSFYFYIWAFPFVVPNLLIFKTLYFLYSFLPPYLYFISHSTLYHPSCQHLISILGFFSFLFFLFFLCPAVTGQVPKLPTTLTFSFSPSL